MTGIYVHIPFCKSRCSYCGFYSTTRIEMRQRYIEAVAKEARLRPTNDTIGTIYLGGGTPSQLSDQQLRQLFDALYNIYKVGSGAEVTIECNPDDITDDFVKTLVQLPVNRVSMGAQTFDDNRLRFLNRRHAAAQVPLAVQRLRDGGIRNISVDLMYGFPGESLDDWQRDIDAVLALDVEHISAYCLTIEEGTVLFEQLKNGENEGMRNWEDEELERTMYELLMDKLAAAGYEHYEISNFARPGFRSRHNTSYWTDVPYRGLGAAAHSYDGQRRQWNVSDLMQYITGVENGTPVVEWEELDADTRYNDRVMLSLRTSEGLELAVLDEHDRTYLLPLAKKYLDEGLLILSAGRLRLSRAGLFVSDMVISDLMRV